MHVFLTGAPVNVQIARQDTVCFSLSDNICENRKLVCVFLNLPSLSDSTNVSFPLFASAVKHTKIQSKRTKEHLDRNRTKQDGFHPTLQPAQPGSICCNGRF